MKRSAVLAFLSVFAASASWAGELSEGTWQVTMPLGATFTMSILGLGDGQYLLSKARIFSGQYVKTENRLVAVDLRDKRLTQMVWKIVSPDRLVLVKGPDVSTTGADYRGTTATLSEPSSAGTEAGGGS